MLRTTLFALLFLTTSAALAQTVQPVITEITPNVVPVAGGTRVVIRGTGFTNNCIICSPPFADPDVFFGGTPAASVRYIDPTMIEAVTPPLLPATMNVTIRQHDTTGVTRNNAITVTGDPLDGFEPLLFPIFLPPVNGAYGSEFHTFARAWSRNAYPVFIYGVDTRCYLFSPVLNPLTDPTSVGTGVSDAELLTGCSSRPGRILYVRKDHASALALNLRVTDVTRTSTNHGTEIPVVRRSDFTTEQRIALLNVPVDPKFRNTLRIYSLARFGASVIVTIGNNSQMVTLEPGRDIFEPAYAAFTDFPASAAPIRVLIEFPLQPGGAPPVPNPPVWSFITVTNNETQQITTITPN